MPNYRLFVALLGAALCTACAAPQTATPPTLAGMMKTHADSITAQNQALRAQRSQEPSPTGTLTTFGGDVYRVAKFGNPDSVAEYYVKPFRQDYRFFREVREIRDNGNHYLIELKSGETIESVDKSKSPLRRYDPKSDDLVKFGEFEILVQPPAGGAGWLTRIPAEAVRSIRID